MIAICFFSGASTIASWLLPFRLRFFEEQKLDQLRNGGPIDLNFGLGLFRLSHGTLLDQLNAQIFNGDPMLLFQMTGETTDGKNYVIAEVLKKTKIVKKKLNLKKIKK